MLYITLVFLYVAVFIFTLFKLPHFSYLNLQVLLLILLHIPQWGGGDSEWLSERLHGA